MGLFALAGVALTDTQQLPAEKLCGNLCRCPGDRIKVRVCGVSILGLAGSKEALLRRLRAPLVSCMCKGSISSFPGNI